MGFELPDSRFDHPGDVADKRAAHAIAGAAAALVGPIELLVHNASELGPTPLRLLLDTECEDLEQVLRVNLVGPFRLTRIVAGLARMIASCERTPSGARLVAPDAEKAA